MSRSAHIGITLGRFLKERQKEFPLATGELSQILRDVSLAARVVHRDINRAGLSDILGSMKRHNVQGEEQQKLDHFANTQFTQALKHGGEVAAILSEEDDVWIDLHRKGGKYIIAIDPLDGSSNIDVNISIGTIFSVYKRLSPTGKAIVKEDFLQCGDKQIVAGYLLYGSSTMLVYTTGYGVYGFTLEPTLGEFILSHPLLKTPPQGAIYSINEGLYEGMEPALKNYIATCKTQGLTSRYIGSLVADFHRNLLKGGIYIYPKTTKAPHGKLRLMYECNALSLIIEQAGGQATDGTRQRILEIKPHSFHQRTPLYIGSKDMVDAAQKA